MIHHRIILPIIFVILKLDVNKRRRRLELFQNKTLDEIRMYQLHKAGHLYEVARKKSIWYREVLKKNHINLKTVRTFDEFKSLPILEKKDVNKISSENSHRTFFKKYFTRETAGTSGRIVKVALDRGSISAQLAARYRFFELYDINPGDKEARFWGRNIAYKNRSMSDLFLNRKLFQFLGSSATEHLKEARDLVKFGPVYMYGYSSLIHTAAMIWQKYGMPKLKLKAIICTAENLLPLQKEFIRKAFDCPVVMEYGCSETDIIAFQCPNGSYHICSENIIIEIDSKRNAIGEVILTDLNNTTTPLIRYRLGDACQLGEENCTCGLKLPVIKSINGRTTGQIVYLESGEQKHAVLFAHLFENLKSRGFQVNKFKVVQKRTENFEIIIDVENEKQISKIKNEIKEKLMDSLGDQITYNFHFEQIPPVVGTKFTYFEGLDMQ